MDLEFSWIMRIARIKIREIRVIRVIRDSDNLL